MLLDSLSRYLNLRPLFALSRRSKTAILISLDASILLFSLWLAFFLRLLDVADLEFSIAQNPWLFLQAPIIGIFSFYIFGLYQSVVRFSGVHLVWTIAKGLLVTALAIWTLAFVFPVELFPRSVPVIFVFIAFSILLNCRFLIRGYYNFLINRQYKKEPVLIYGAGGAGLQLQASMQNSAEYVPVVFVDDNPKIWGQRLAGLKVESPDVIEALIKRFTITKIVLAIPSLNKQQRKITLDRLAQYHVQVKSIPALPNIISGVSIDDLTDIDPEELLGREPVPPKSELLSLSIKQQVVMVSGAGGSIGSEICRQVIALEPKALVLYEISEFALYQIEQELKALLPVDSSISLYPVLGTVQDRQSVTKIIQHFNVDTIYHAAAYKHVPMVEHNVLEGLRNNSFGTLMMAEAAVAAKVKRFILISTDKAVRPTNVMGATKRLAELILQDYAGKNTQTIFSMVRFGNVLASSGSVVPLFKKQIKQGGPVTVTHPEITRFFMTIKEASLLVIQAGSMAKGGEVFVLDMGEPVRILDLAKQMISLSGLDYALEADAANEDAIQIQFSGLRKGEKLYEEVLIGDNVLDTQHPRILAALENKLTSEQLQQYIEALIDSLSANDACSVHQLLQKIVSGFNPSTPVADWLVEDFS